MSSSEQDASDTSKTVMRTALYLRICGLAGVFIAVVGPLLYLRVQILYTGEAMSKLRTLGGSSIYGLSLLTETLICILPVVGTYAMYGTCVWFFCGYFARMLEQYAARLEASGSPGNESECGAGERG